MNSKLIILALAIFVSPSIQEETIPCELDFLGVIPHPVASLCNFYVVCVFGLGNIRECPVDHVFFKYNETFGECEPGYVETCSRTTIPPPTTTTTTTLPPPPPTTTTTTIGIGTPTPPPPGIPNDICDGIFYRRLPHPNNCYQFILCSFGRPYLGECNPGRIFVRNLGICFRGDRETCETCLFC